MILSFKDDLLAIDLWPTAPGQPCWRNDWLLGLDTASLYGLLRHWNPRHYVEIGSGNSTMVAARARSDGGLDTTITSIDPQPRAEIDRVCDRVVREPLELVDLSLFKELSSGDVVFVDCSHRVFTNSDVTTFYLDVLPELPGGVFVGIHDVLWPDDYLPEWREYWFSEQYLLGAFLLAETPWLRPILACNYVSGRPDLAAILDPIWKHLAPSGVDTRGFAFWFRVAR